MYVKKTFFLFPFLCRDISRHFIARVLPYTVYDRFLKTI